jgi:hypothetical protein
VIKDGKELLGLADGIAGVLYILIMACRVVQSLRANQTLISSIQATLEYILGYIDKFGYLPRSPDTFDYEVTVNHGSPGLIPLLVTAAESFPHM